MLDFLKDLLYHNNRTWFEANKKRFETTLKAPFEAIIQAALDLLAQEDAVFVGVRAKDCVYRIYRDVRFSADKTPYKTNVSAVLAPLGRKQAGAIGLYVELSYGRLLLASGVYLPSPAEVAAIRQHIIAHNDRFEAILAAPAFKACFGTLQGDESKRLTGSFAEAAKKQPLLLKKQFLYMAELPASTIYEADIAAILCRYYRAAADMSAFLNEAQGVAHIRGE